MFLASGGLAACFVFSSPSHVYLDAKILLRIAEGFWVLVAQVGWLFFVAWGFFAYHFYAIVFSPAQALAISHIVAMMLQTIREELFPFQASLSPEAEGG